MEEKKTTEGTEKKLSYEQLNDTCNQLFHQNKALQERCRELESFNMFKRLDYLFKVVENANTIGDTEFVCYCVSEIKEAIVIPENPKEA